MKVIEANENHVGQNSVTILEETLNYLVLVIKVEIPISEDVKIVIVCVKALVVT